MTHRTPSDEQRIEQLEAAFPLAAAAAFSKAYDEAIRAGHSVMVSEEGAIYEIFPDGQRKLIKKIDPPTRTRPGLKIEF